MSGMETVGDDAYQDRLYLKALTIRHERRIGLWLPIMWHLALRGHAGAMTELADWFSDGNKAKAFGRLADPFSAAGLYRRAVKKGHSIAGFNAAMSCFNRNDMIGYRDWLRQAASAGDGDARDELRRFETRLPHSDARKVGRLRPDRRSQP